MTSLHSIEATRETGYPNPEENQQQLEAQSPEIDTPPNPQRPKESSSTSSARFAQQLTSSSTGTSNSTTTASSCSATRMKAAVSTATANPTNTATAAPDWKSRVKRTIHELQSAPTMKVSADSYSSSNSSIERPASSAMSDAAWNTALAIALDYNIDPYDHSDEQLMDCTVVMFQFYDLLHSFNFSESTLRVFMDQVRQFYNPENLFHNFKHVWSVMHMCFSILRCGGEEHLEAMDVFAVLVSALCHDLHHPGNNNAFEVATDSELSKLYCFPDEACVLEHHHAQSTHKLLISDEQELCRGLSRFDRENFFKQVEFIILGTDMEKHSKLLAEATALTAHCNSSSSGSSGSNTEDSPTTASSPSAAVVVAAASSSSAAAEATMKKQRVAPVHVSVSAPLLSSTATDSGDTTSCSSASSAATTAAATTATTTAAAGDIGEISSMPEKVERSVSGSQLPSQITITHQCGSHSVDKRNSQSRLMFTRVLVHTADIGAQTQSKDVAFKWMQRCYGEFRSQASKERGLGIMTSPFLHDLQEDYKMYASQYTFIAGIVEPIWTALARFLPKLQFAVEQLVENKAGYQKMLEDYHAAQKATALLQQQQQEQQQRLESDK